MITLFLEEKKAPDSNIEQFLWIIMAAPLRFADVFRRLKARGWIIMAAQLRFADVFRRLTGGGFIKGT
jgi:hypothetical protein